MNALPVDPALPRLVRALDEHGAAILQAPPGTGKSTRAPPAVLAHLPPEEELLVLQPRRAAARSVARRMAEERGEELGETIGYRVRHEARVGPATRLTVLTEGLLARRLLDDPLLEGGAGRRRVGAVVLDEVHERNLQTDLCLAALVEVRTVRPDLKLLLMSATLDAGPLSGFLGGSPVLDVPARTWPVQIEHLGPDLGPEDRDLVERVEVQLRRLLAEDVGDLLVFLPGAGEIHRLEGRLQDLRPALDVLPLHGSLPAAAQDRALRPDPASGRRRVILATDLAETSLTIPGVRLVLDSGLCRRPRLDPARGLELLLTEPISRASAEQRAGRAGRTGPGRCVRLWSAHQHGRRPAHAEAEIERVELCSLALWVAAWGSAPRWLTPPPPASWAAAQGLLRGMGALDERGLTPLGRELAALPLHPRVGRILLQAREGAGGEALAALAALLEERDPWPRRGGPRVEARLQALLGGPALGADPGLLSAAREASRQLLATTGRRHAGERAPGAERVAAIDRARLVEALAVAWPERLARRRQVGEPRVLLAGGRGAVLGPEAGDDGAEWLFALRLRAGRGGEDEVELALPLAPAEVESLPWAWRRRVAWEESRGAVVVAEERALGALVLQRRERPADPDEAEQGLLQAAMADPVSALRPAGAALHWLHRVLYLRERGDAEVPAWADLAEALRELLPALVAGRRRLPELAEADLTSALLLRLGAAVRARVERRAPGAFTLPAGPTVELDYDPDSRQGGAPVLRARVQQLFGLDRQPAVLDGAEPVTLHLLGPHGRPIQITRDLPGFWRGSWASVRKELRGRYPKHAWPEDPWNAPARPPRATAR